MRIRRVCSLAASAALHAAVVLMLAVLPSRERGAAEPAPQTWGTARTFVVTPVAPPSAAGDEVLEGGERQAGTDIGSDEAADLRVAGFDFETATIGARRNWLFPFLTTDLLFLEGVDHELRSAERKMVDPHASGRRRSPKPVLWISDAQVQTIVDRAWSRRDRWPRFSEIAALVDTHDPDEGRVPEMIHAYLDQNLLQPYYDTNIRDPRFWAMLACVADHVEFVDWIRSFTREHPSSRTTTELLFLLDELAQGSRDTLLMLLATNPEWDLRHTREKNPQAYDLAVAVRRQYAEWLAQRRLESAVDIKRRYDDVRLRILMTIVVATPDDYRASDARFLAGEILFNRNDLAGAVRWWREMRPREGDSYENAASEILRELASPRGPNAAQLNRILGAEYRRWLDFSRTRLQEFGYAFDTF